MDNLGRRDLFEYALGLVVGGIAVAVLPAAPKIVERIVEKPVYRNRGRMIVGEGGSIVNAWIEDVDIVCAHDQRIIDGNLLAKGTTITFPGMNPIRQV